MKKILLFLTVVMFVFTFSACNLTKQNELPQEQTFTDNSEAASESETIKEKESKTNLEFIGLPTRKIISVCSIDELKQMKEMLSCEDEETLKNYCESIGAHSKDDLELFLELCDRYGVVNTIGGKISSISYMESEVLTTGDDYTEFSIVVKAENGDWIAYEYRIFSEYPFDVKPPEGDLLDGPLTSDDNRITLFWETRRPATINGATSIRRRALIDGVHLMIREVTTNPNEVSVDEILNGELVTASSMME